MIFSVTGVIVLAKLSGFVKQMLTAGLFGATLETDLILLSQTFAGDLQYLLAQVLLTAFTATYIHVREKDEASSRQFVSNTLMVFSLLAAALAGLVLLFAPWIARIIAPSYTPEVSARLASYLRVYAPALLLFVWSAVFQALLSANKRFVLGEMTTVNQNILYSLIVLALSARMGAVAMVVAFFVYTIWNTAFLASFARRYWKPVAGNPFHDPALRELLHMVGPLLFGYCMVYVNQQVDKILVSGLGDGVVTALTYGSTLYSLVSTFICSFCSILFTYVTTSISKGEHRQAAGLAVNAAGVLILVFLPVSLLFTLCSHDIITIVFGRGAFDAGAVESAAAALSGYAIAFVPLILREVFSRFQYGYQDSKWPSISSSMGIVGNIILSVALCPYLGVFGVTVATSAAITICSGLNVFFSRRHNAFLQFRPLLRQLPFLVAGGGVCVLVILWGNRFWQGESAFLRFMLTGICAAAGYFVTVSPLLLRLFKSGGLTISR